MRNQTPFALCLIGGLFLIGANYTSGIGTIALIYVLVHSIAALTPVYLLIDILLFILVIIAWSGGIAVILGGFLLTTSQIRLGKLIISIAAGFGLISFILGIIWIVITFGWIGLLALTWLVLNTAWALGLVLTIIARSTAK
ncbi:MAG: hypothetical protein KAR03_12175 [Candidatus Thorarchaeota archaeon]|nr:hypothetical protein [Candidatus Thorarchaeota archaeon]